MRWPSTDNLYKPIAISGLVLVIGSAYVVLNKGMDYSRQREAASHEHWEQYEVQPQNRCVDLRASSSAYWRCYKTIQEAFDRSPAGERLRQQEEKLEVLENQLTLYEVIGLAAIVTGFAAMGWGFWTWFGKSPLGRKIVLIAGWLVSSIGLLASAISLEVNVNLLVWSPKANVEVIASGIGILVALCVTWFLSKTGQDKVIRIVSVLLCLALSGIAGWILLEEGQHDAPVWYRGGRTFALCLPALFWLYWTFKGKQISVRRRDRGRR